MAKKQKSVTVHAVQISKKRNADIWDWCNHQKSLSNSFYMLAKFAKALCGDVDWPTALINLATENPEVVKKFQSSASATKTKPASQESVAQHRSASSSVSSSSSQSSVSKSSDGGDARSDGSSPLNRRDLKDLLGDKN